MAVAVRWIKHDTYYMLAEATMGKKIGRRLTAHRFGAAAGHTKYASREETADEIAGLRKVTLTDVEKANIDRGLQVEPVAIEWYEKQREVKVGRFNLCIPIWDPEIGCIPDGDVEGKGLISVKGPKAMYKSLTIHTERIADGWTPPSGYHKHIWDSHYDQMQGEMAIVDRPWCDYIVYAVESNMAYTERIYRDDKYWEGELYPLLREFKEKYLKPRMGVIQIPSFDDACDDSSS